MQNVADKTEYDSHKFMLKRQLAARTRVVWIPPDSAPDKASSLTKDNAWHDLNLTSDTSPNAKGVIISVRATRVVGDGGSLASQIYTRINGSSADHEGIIEEYHQNNSGGNVNYSFGNMIWQAVDKNQILEYKISSSGIVIVNFYILGYWE